MNDLIFYKKRFNLFDAHFVSIEHEDASVAIVYRIIAPKRPPYILKICPRAEDYWREIYFLKLFSETLPVAKIIDAEELSSTHYGAILMECFSGSILHKTKMTDKLAYESGSLCARVHLNRVNQYGDLTQKESLNSDLRTPFAHKFEESFSECVNHLPQAMLEKAYQYYKDRVDILVSVDGPCIIHRDYRPGNMMALENQITGIIDWASARASFAEEDFSPLELNEWSQDAKLKKSFLNGYASIRPIPEYKLIMPLLLMNRAFSTIGFTLKKRTWDNVNASAYQANFKYLEEFTNTILRQ